MSYISVARRETPSYQLAYMSLICSDAMSGTSADWAAAVANITYSYLVELRDTGQRKFVLLPTEIRPTGEEQFAGLVTVLRGILTRLGINNPTVDSRGCPKTTAEDRYTYSPVTVSRFDRTTNKTVKFVHCERHEPTNTGKGEAGIGIDRRLPLIVASLTAAIIIASCDVPRGP